MKKILVSIVAMLVAAPSFAQFSSGGFELDKESMYYGVRIGLTAANLSGGIETYDQKEYKTDLGMKTGLTLAGVLGLRLSSSTPVFLESGLYYTERGGKDGKFKVSYTNLEVPLLIKYGLQASNDIAVLPFVGPYFAYAVSGKTKNGSDQFEKESGTFDEKKARTGGLNRFNMGFKLGCGFEYNMLYLEAGYQFGLSNIGKNGPGENLDLDAKSNALFVNFGVNF
jgi:hypothetical protein